MMHVPYNPPEPVLMMLAQMTPVDINQMIQRLGVVKQLIKSKDTTLNNNTKSKLQKTIKSDLTRLLGRGFDTSQIDISNMKKSNFRNLKREQTLRKWNSYLATAGGSDGLIYQLPSNYLLDNELPPDENVRNIGRLASLFTGHCNLGLHKYKLKLCYTPTCTCLVEDESVDHFVFKCPMYNNLRNRLEITVNSVTMEALLL